MCLMNVVTTYLYDSLDSVNYMKVLKGLKLPRIYNSKLYEMYSIKLHRYLYELK
jgi:hypothetical protein